MYAPGLMRGCENRAKYRHLTAPLKVKSKQLTRTADAGQPPPRKNTVLLACGTVKYLHSFEMNRLRKFLFLQPEDVQVSTIAPGTVCVTLSERGGLYQRLSPAALLKFSISSSLPVPSPGALPHSGIAAPRSPAARMRCPVRPEQGRAAPVVVAVAAVPVVVVVAVAVSAAAQAAGAARPFACLRGRAAFPSHRGPLPGEPRDAGPLRRLSSAPARGGEQPLAGRQPPPSPWLAAPPSGILLPPPLLRVIEQSNLRQRRGSMSGTKYVDSEVGRLVRAQPGCCRRPTRAPRRDGTGQGAGSRRTGRDGM